MPGAYLKVFSLSIVIFLLFLSPASFSFTENASSLFIDFNGRTEKNGLPGPWNLKIKEGKVYAAAITDKGVSILHLKALSSSFAVERDLFVSPRSYPFLSWSWMALKLPVSGDVRKKGYNDQGLQIVVAFENRKVLSYVWDSNAPEGTIMDESIGWPVNLGIKVLVVKSGAADTGKWITHTRNLREDYMHLYGEEPPRIKGIRIQMNTQYTKDTAEGFVQGFTLSSEPVVPEIAAK